MLPKTKSGIKRKGLLKTKGAGPTIKVNKSGKVVKIGRPKTAKR